MRFGPADPQPLSELVLARQSNHLWQVALPGDLEVGVHTAKVRTIDMYGQEYEETKIFAVLESRPAPFFRLPIRDAIMIQIRTWLAEGGTAETIVLKS